MRWNRSTPEDFRPASQTKSEHSRSMERTCLKKWGDNDWGKHLTWSNCTHGHGSAWTPEHKQKYTHMHTKKKITLKQKLPRYQERYLEGKDMQDRASVFLQEQGGSKMPTLGNYLELKKNQSQRWCVPSSESACGLCSLSSCRLDIEKEASD